MKASKNFPEIKSTQDLTKTFSKKFRECDSKVFFKTEKLANTHIQSFVKFNPSQYLRSYKCSQCEGYHTTSQQPIQMNTIELDNVVVTSEVNLMDFQDNNTAVYSLTQSFEFPQDKEEIKSETKEEFKPDPYQSQIDKLSVELKLTRFVVYVTWVMIFIYMVIK